MLPCRYFALVSVVSAGLGPALSFARSNANQLISSELAQLVGNLIQEHRVPGLVLGIVSGSQSTIRAWGNRTEEGDPMAADTIFNLASCSKAFVTTSLGILMDDYANGRNVTPLPLNVARLGWDTKLTDLLPDEWMLMDAWASEKANLRDILSHTSGLPRHDFSYHRTDTTTDVLLRQRFLRPAFELRERFSYTNQMYAVGAHVVSKYTGSFVDYATDRIFKALNMTQTTYFPDEALGSGKAADLFASFGRRVPWWFSDAETELDAGPGGVNSNAEDLVKWVQMLLGHGEDAQANVSIIPTPILDEITTANAIVFGNTTVSSPSSIEGYGLGWFRYTVAGIDIIDHDGSIPGISTYIGLVPSVNMGIIVLINADGQTDVYTQIKTAILQEIAQSNVTSQQPLISTRSSLEPRTVPLEVDRDSKSSIDYTGSYHDDGYGNFTLCGPLSSVDQCRQVLQDFAIVDQNPLPEGSLVAAWPTTLSTHMRLVPSNASAGAFDLIPTNLFTSGYGRNSTPFEFPTGQFSATFVVADGVVVGLGLTGEVGEETDRQRRGGSVEETSDVFFRHSSSS
ncbi:beta-lactamase/transpeptidase-like protein [Amylostereum chailletii]|nr:beta-lactamase/transpeptidase-like protein [Amylostereum chailletii]